MPAWRLTQPHHAVGSVGETSRCTDRIQQRAGYPSPYTQGERPPARGCCRSPAKGCPARREQARAGREASLRPADSAPCRVLVYERRVCSVSARTKAGLGPPLLEERPPPGVLPQWRKRNEPPGSYRNADGLEGGKRTPCEWQHTRINRKEPQPVPVIGPAGGYINQHGPGNGLAKSK